MAEGLTRQERLNRLQNARRIVEEESKALGLSPEELGENGDQKVEDRDPLALEFDRMSPKEKYLLYIENRPRWRELAAAKQGEEVRTLLRKR